MAQGGGPQKENHVAITIWPRFVSRIIYISSLLPLHLYVQFSNKRQHTPHTYESFLFLYYLFILLNYFLAVCFLFVCLFYCLFACWFIKQHKNTKCYWIFLLHQWQTLVKTNKMPSLLIFHKNVICSYVFDSFLYNFSISAIF